MSFLIFDVEPTTAESLARCRVLQICQAFDKIILQEARPTNRTGQPKQVLITTWRQVQRRRFCWFYFKSGVNPATG